MAFPTNWPPRASSSVRSVRVYIAGTTTANFSDNAYLFAEVVSANTFTPMPVIAPGSHQTVNVPPVPNGSGTATAVPDPLIAQAATPAPMVWARAILIHNTGASDLEFSFDGTNVHGWVKAGDSVTYFDRYEAGISVRGAGGTGTFKVEAW